MKLFIVLFVLGAVLARGYGLQCLVSQCQEVDGKTTQCQPGGGVQTCPQGHDHCMTMSLTMKQAAKTVTTISNNCTVALACQDAGINATCQGIRQGGGSCAVECCNTDMCNAKGTNTTDVVKPLPPSNKTEVIKGENLSCYVCQTGYESNDTTLVGDSCDKPKQRKCEGASGDRPTHDRCGVTKYQRKDANTGKITDVELRNCTHSVTCANMCQFLNQTGDLVSCDMICCVGNLCNGEEASPSPPTGGQDTCALVNFMTVLVGVIVFMCLK